MKKCKTASDLVEETLALMQTDKVYSETKEAACLDYTIGVFGNSEVLLKECGFDTIGYVNYGTSEGIYGDISIRGNWGVCGSRSLFTFKSLSTSKDVYLAIGTLVAMFSYYADKVVRKWLSNNEID